MVLYCRSVGGLFIAIAETEIRKAILSLAEKKAPGPDGLITELCRHMPSLLTPISALFNVIMINGRFPQSMVQLRLVFHNKPSKPPDQCGSKRPIPMISILSKALQVVILIRLMEQLEGILTNSQYASCRDRGTDHLLLDLADFVSGQRSRGKFVYVASIDVDGAFDTAPRQDLVDTVVRLGADGFTCRCLAEWLFRREFQVALRTPFGRYFSTWRRLSRSLPQGWVFPPFLWLLYFNSLPTKILVAESRRFGPAGGVFIKLLFSADDITCGFSHERRPTLCLASPETAEDVGAELRELGLATADPKSGNMLMSPSDVVGDLHRRGTSATRKGCIERKKRGGQLEALWELCADPPLSLTGSSTAQTTTAPGGTMQPFRCVKVMKVLGLLLDSRL